MLLSLSLWVGGRITGAIKSSIITEGTSGGSLQWVDLAVDETKQVHLIWVSSDSQPLSKGKVDNHLYYQSISGDSVVAEDRIDITGLRFRVDGLPSIACNSDGRVAITAYCFDRKLESRGTFLWIFRDHQGTSGEPIRLGQRLISPDRCGIADVAVGDNGVTIVAYETPSLVDSGGYGGRSIWYELFDSNGVPLLPATQARSGANDYHRAENPTIAVNSSGKFVIAWNAELLEDIGLHKAQVFARLFNADGAPASAEIVVSCEGFPETCMGDSSIFVAGPAGKFPSVVIDDRSEFAVAFRNSYCMECRNEFFVLRRFDAGGKSLEPMQRIGDLTECAAFPHPPCLASESTGRLVAVWSNNNVAGKESRWHNVFVQKYGSDGHRLGENRRLNLLPATLSSGCQWRMALDMTNSGFIAIATVCGAEQSEPMRVILQRASFDELAEAGSRDTKKPDDDR